MFYETKHKNTAKIFIVSYCAVYAIINNYVCIDYLACRSKKLSVMCIDKNTTVKF